MNVPSRIDASAAPAGKDAVVVLVPSGHLLEGQADRGLDPQNIQDWKAMVSKARVAVFETVRQRTGIDLEPLVVKETINTPASWKEKFNLDKGAILGLSHSFFNVLSFRPKTRHATIKDLYFVGASTHPGTGVPIVLAGSKITADQILTDLRLRIPWSPGHHKRRIVSSLDKEGWAPIEIATLLMWVALVYFAIVFAHLAKGLI